MFCGVINVNLGALFFWLKNTLEIASKFLKLKERRHLLEDIFLKGSLNIEGHRI